MKPQNCSTVDGHFALAVIFIAFAVGVVVGSILCAGLVQAQYDSLDFTVEQQTEMEWQNLQRDTRPSPYHLPIGPRATSPFDPCGR